jgi:hypothetical protein
MSISIRSTFQATRSFIVVPCTLAALLVFAGTAQAGMTHPTQSELDAAPQEYTHVPRLGAYKSLLNAKCLWLNDKIIRHERALNTLRSQLRGASDAQKEIIDEQIQQHQQVIKDAKAELTTLGGPLGGPRNKAQEALVKKNVEAWIGALRAKASTYRDRAEKDARAAAEANNKKEAAGQRVQEADDKTVANQAEKTAGELAADLKEANL